MDNRRNAPCPCGSGKKTKRCCGATGRPAAPAPAAGNPDRDWVHAHVLNTGDLVLYGSLMEDLEELDPATFWGEFRRLAEAYLGHGPGRTQAWHERIDRLLEQLIERDQRYGYPPPFCSKGCCNCCHEPVYCTDEEAGEILEHCRREAIAIDAAKLERQLAWLEVDGARDHTGTTRWNDQPEADQSCVFLDPAEGACRIWQVRPFVCRVHLAEGTGDYCRPRNGVPDPRARGISYPEWSYVLSVIFTIHQDSIRKSLGRLLLGT